MKSHVAKQSVIDAIPAVSGDRLVKLLNFGDLPFKPDIDGLAAGDARIALPTAREPSVGGKVSFCSRRVSLGVG